jgi:hypothetical protein
VLSDPMSLTIGATTYSLPRTALTSEPRNNRTVAVYKDSSQTITLTVTQEETGKSRLRHLVRVEWKKIVADPLTAANDYDQVSINYTIDRPLAGFSVADVIAFRAGLAGLLTDATVTKLFGGES